MRKILLYMSAAMLVLAFTACNRPASDNPDVISTADEEPVVLDEGSVAKEQPYFIDDTGRVIYTDSRELVPSGENGTMPERNPSLPSIFAGAQRIYPAGENPEERESYITTAPFDAVEYFYLEYLKRGVLDPTAESDGPESIVNVIASTGNDGKRQSALFINYPRVENPDEVISRAGMKVLLKEFPGQHAVQIILTTLDSTPAGLNPIGMWISAEEADQLIEDYEARQAEAEAAKEAADESGDTDNSGGNSTDENDGGGTD